MDVLQRPWARLAGFGGLAALVFAGATLAGRAAGPVDAGEPSALGHGHGGAEPGAPAPEGLAVSADGLTLTPLLRSLPAGGGEYAFRITRADGTPLRDFDTEHGRRMHLVAVRRDLTGFRHVHPSMDADGTWRVVLDPATAGAHRVFADFATRGRRRTLGVDLDVPGPAAARPLPPPGPVTATGPVQVALDAGGPRAGREGELVFRVTQGGLPAGLGTYLGARGHLVALREGDLAYLHAHPTSGGGPGEVRMAVSWPSAGRYRLFLEVRAAGGLRRAETTVDVAP